MTLKAHKRKIDPESFADGSICPAENLFAGQVIKDKLTDYVQKQLEDGENQGVHSRRLLEDFLVEVFKVTKEFV